MFELLIFFNAIVCTTQKHRGIIYARVSTKEQAEKGFSIPSQIDEMEEKAKKLGIELPYPPVIEAESGLDFERPGLLKIIKMAEEKKIEYVLVIDLDRIGRDMVERIYYLSKLSDRGVKAVTKEREWNFDNLEDALLGAVDAYRSEKEVRQLAERTQRGKCRAFKEKKWVHAAMPRCYERDGNWIRKKGDDAADALIENIFEGFKKRRSCPVVVDELGERFREVFNEDLTVGKMKSILKNPTYAGRPRYRNVEVRDPDLAVVDDETFEEVQRILDNIAEKHRKKEGRNNVLNGLAKEYGWGYVFRVTDIFFPHCPKCGSRMVHAGEKTVRGMAIDRYKCRDCGHTITIPTGAQMDKFKNVNLLRCPYCGETEYFEVKNRFSDDGYRYEYTCKHCRGSFCSSASPNKYLRRFSSKKDRKFRRTEKGGKRETPQCRTVRKWGNQDERQKMVVNYLRDHPGMEIGRSDYMRLANISSTTTATRDLTSLYKRKVLGRKGVGKAIHYYLL